ncbi:MAG TPA: DUF5668 domain-containing protein [Melioribacteraceae bacterium]|nr:DUF5668 domain-containing protein [Melioribacteraceae bacterium]
MKNDGKIWIGIILIAVGALLVADNFFYFDFSVHHLIFSWHTIFLIIGLVILNNSKNSVVGIVFVVLGLFGILGYISPFDIRFSLRDYWPIILIIVGFFILFRRREPNILTNPEGSKQEFQTSTASILDESSIFNSTNRIIDSDNFRGGKATTIFGSTKLDLTRASLSPGENTLEITCLFGGCDISIPKTWKVILNVSAIFGGFEDKRFLAMSDAKTEGVLIIKGTVIFGGGEITSY